MTPEQDIGLGRIVVRAIYLDAEMGRALERLAQLSMPNPRGQLLAIHTADAPWAGFDPGPIESFLDHVEARVREFAIEIGRAPLPIVARLQAIGWHPAAFSALARAPKKHRPIELARREVIRAALDDVRTRLEIGLRRLELDLKSVKAQVRR